jgi:hypothetical protein
VFIRQDEEERKNPRRLFLFSFFLSSSDPIIAAATFPTPGSAVSPELPTPVIGYPEPNPP